MLERQFLIFIVLSFSFFIYSCNKDHVAEYSFYDQNNDILEPVGQIKIKIDSQTDHRTGMMAIFNDSILTYQNKPQICIQFYDIKRQIFLNKICFEVKGINGVGNLQGYLIENLDSIYIIGDHTRSIVLANQHRLVTQGFKLSRDYGTPVGITFFPLLRIEQKLYFATGPDFNLYTASSVGQEMEIEYDLLTQSSYSHFHFPLEYEGFHNVYYITYSRDIDDEQNFVYSFPMCHDLYIKTKQGIIKKIPAKSRYIKSATIEKNTGFANQMEEMKAYIEGYAYRFIIFDKYRKVYYRFARHPIPYLHPSTNLPQRADDKPYSIIVLDKQFRKLGEYLLPTHKYLTDNYFVNSEGLWISNNHPDNPDLEEDYISFTLFRLNSPQ